MKKLLLLVALFSTLTARAADYDVVTGLDLTGYSSVPGSLLNQLVNTATFATNKGGILLTNGTPNITANPRYTNWIWLNNAYVPPIVSVYNGPSYGWLPIGVGVGSVGSVQLQVGAVLSTNIGAGQVVTFNIGAGAVANGNMAVGSVSATNILGGSVGNYQLATNSISNINLGSNSVLSTNIGLNVILGTNIAFQTIQGTNIATNTISGTNIAFQTIAGTNVALQTLLGTNLVNNTIGTNQVQSLTAITTTNNVSMVAYTYTSVTNTAFQLSTNSSSLYTFGHGLGVVPSSIRVVYACITSDNGYSPGDEVDISTGQGTNSGGSTTQRAENVYSDATNVYIRTSSVTSAYLGNKGTGSGALLNTTKWVYKVYAIGYR